MFERTFVNLSDCGNQIAEMRDKDNLIQEEIVMESKTEGVARYTYDKGKETQSIEIDFELTFNNSEGTKNLYWDNE